jgi:dTDP-4-dehydrorhamnose reductase
VSQLIVVPGANGQVGRSLINAAERRGRAVKGLDRSACNVTDGNALTRAVAGAGLVVNCSAYTAVDKAESEPEVAFQVNTDALRLMAQACAAEGIPLIHVSTDYVFDGSGDRPWKEDDPVAPLNVYGCSKLAGEEAVRESCPEHIILRTSWVFSPYGANFVKTMRRLGATRPDLRVVDDQFGGPTAASDIAEAILTIADAIACGLQAWGTYHFCGQPATTWHAFAQAILADIPTVTVHPIPTLDYPTPAERPRYSVLDCARIGKIFGIEQPDWRISLASVLDRLNEEEPLTSPGTAR